MESPDTKKEAKKEPSHPYTFANFMRPPALVLNTVGLIFWPRTNYWNYKWQLFHFFSTLCLINLAIASELAYEVEFFKVSKNMMEGTALMIYVIYSVLSEIKILCLFKNLGKINKLISTLNDIFPVTKSQMAAYNLKEYHRRILLLTIPVTFVMWFTVSFYTSTSVYMYFFSSAKENGELRSILQFYFWYPFEIDSALTFFVALVHQCHASQVCVLCVLGCDALLTCILLQICMHLDALSMRLKKRHRVKGDIKDLSIILHHHDLVLRLMNEVNEAFSSPVFITFLSSSFVVCFGGFQVINGTNTLDIMKFFLFLLYELIKVFQTSLLGDMLMESSTNIGEYAYKTNWYENSISYQKVIQIIICRSQKPANLNAITFHEVCLISFKEIMSKSYTFFTLLHTMYNT